MDVSYEMPAVINWWMNEYAWMTLNEKTDKNSNNKSSNSPPFNGKWEQNVFLFLLTVCNRYF